MDIRYALHRNEDSEPHLIGYLPALYPDMRTYQRLLDVYSSAGLRFMEIGMPVTDPYLDGDIIKQALKTVEAFDVPFEKMLAESMKRVRKANMASVLMLYNETFQRYGVNDLVKLCVENKVDAILIPNITSQGRKTLYNHLAKTEVKTANFIRYQADNAEIEEILTYTTGFVYLQSMDGVTGGQFTENRQVKERILQVKKAAAPYRLPIVLGFGISTPEDALKASLMEPDAIVVGTACVEAAEKGLAATKTFLEGFHNFLQKREVKTWST